MDERPGELGGAERREQQPREGAPTQQHESEARGATGGRGRDDRQRRDPRHRRGGGQGGGGGRERQQGGAGSQQQRPEASLNMDELRELFDLFTAQGFTEFELEKEGFRVRLRRDLSPQGAAGSSHLAPVPAPPQPAHVLPFVAPQQQAAQSEAQPAQAQSALAAAKSEAAAPAAEADLHVITSPIVGTFYRAASPASDPFVGVGSHVGPDTVVCIIEAMKLMNEIQAEVSGTVEKIYVENGQPVEYGQPLFGIKK